MTKLSTGQVRTLTIIEGASGRGAPFIPPRGPSGRPAKFLKTAELVEQRGTLPGLWVTEKGREVLTTFKGRAA